MPTETRTVTSPRPVWVYDPRAGQKVLAVVTSTITVRPVKAEAPNSPNT